MPSRRSRSSMDRSYPNPGSAETAGACGGAAERLEESAPQGPSPRPSPASLDRVRAGRAEDVAGGWGDLDLGEGPPHERRMGEPPVEAGGDGVEDLEQPAEPPVVDLSLRRLGAGLDPGRNLIRRDHRRDGPDPAARVVGRV